MWGGVGGGCARVCNIQHITLFFVTAADIDSHRALLDDRFVSARTIPQACLSSQAHMLLLRMTDTRGLVCILHNWTTKLNSCKLVGEQCHSVGQRMMTYVGFQMHMCYALFRSHEQPKVRDRTKLTMQPGRRLVLHLKYSSKCVNETYPV